MKTPWQKPPASPAPVKLEDVREDLEAAREGTAVLGLGEAGPMTLDLDYSHVLVVAGTGKGKSVLIRSVLAQQLAHGAEVVILDQTWGAHRWAKRHPDVTYARDIDDIHHQLVRLGEELADRMVADHAEVMRSRRLVVAIENRGNLVDELRRFWEAARVPGLSPEGGSPAVAALAALEWASPLLRINLVTASQSSAFLPIATRAAYGLRIAGASISDESWQNLTDDLPRPAGTSTWHPGRFCVIRGMATAPLEALYLEPTEARHLVAAVIAAGRGKWGVA